MLLTWGAATDRGLVRPANEDAIVASPPVFAVADGMGGHVGGAIASEIVTSGLGALSGRRDLTVADVLDALRSVTTELRRRAAAEPALQDMGSTVTGIAAVSEGDVEHWMVFNVGDSRVYRLRDGQLEQLTVDHSEVEELIRSGVLSSEEAATYPRRNVVTRSMAASAPPAIDHWLLPPAVGERFIACSDGLVTELGADRICEIASAARGPQHAAESLVGAAVAAGGHDNVSVVVVDVTGLDNAFDPLDADTAPRNALR